MCHILTTGKQRKTSNHSSARKLEPVQKDPVLSVFNCCWWLLVSHAWQCVCHAASCLCSFLSAFTPGDEYYSSDQSRERRKKKKQSPHRHKATCTQITQATGTEHQKWTAKASLYQPLPPDSFMLKKKKRKKWHLRPTVFQLARFESPVCLIICLNTCLGLCGAIWITIE